MFTFLIKEGGCRWNSHFSLVCIIFIAVSIVFVKIPKTTKKEASIIGKKHQTPQNIIQELQRL
jgi:hypothetical protein